MKILSTNYSKYDHIIKWCLEDILGLEKYNLNITFCVLRNNPSTNCSGRFMEPDHIEIDQHLDEYQTIKTLLHELRHYYQSITDMFDFDFEKHTYMTNNENIDYTDCIKFRDEYILKQFMFKLYQSYLNYPWELDANKFVVETFGKYLGDGKEYCKKHIWQGNYENYDNGG